MTTTRMDKTGRLTLPKELLAAHGWRGGAEFQIEDRPEGLLLRPLRAPDGKKVQAATGQHGLGRDRTLANAMRDRAARLGH